MKRLAFFTALSLAFVAVPASAQVNVYGGGGGAFPTGDDMDGVESGLQLFGGAEFDVSEMVSLYVEGQWGTHNLEDVDDVTVSPRALMAGLLLGFGSDGAPVSPYVFGGGGLQSVSIDVDGDSTSDSAFGFQVGGGLNFPLGGVDGFGEVRYQTAGFADDAEVLTDATFAIFSVVVGLSIQVGGN